MNYFKLRSLKEYSIFFWLIFIAIIGIITSTIYSNTKNEQSFQIKTSLSNIYLKKTIKEITKNLEPRYKTEYYISKSGDTYESIVNKLDVNKKEKKILLSSILQENSLKILKIN